MCRRILADVSEDSDEEGDGLDELIEGPSDEQRVEAETWVAESQRLFEEMAAVVAALDASDMTADDFVEARARIGLLYSETNTLAAKIAGVFGLRSAQARLMHYLRLHVSEAIDGGALAGVSCIWEWARRTRELDVEHGWEIVVGRDDELGLGHNEYMLTTEERNRTSAAKWRRLSRIRREPGSGESRILALLQESYPEAVSREDLDYVAQIRSRDRRKRDLEEAGWRISSYEDDPSLPTGHYRLDTLEKGPPRAREHIKLRQEILQSADFTCKQCGARPGPGKRVILHVHHREFVGHGGTNDPANLEVLCRQCHAGKHAVAVTQVDDELLNPAADPYLSGGD
jgi:5-methylcytosine-specific restriction endonuclease McrA